MSVHGPLGATQSGAFELRSPGLEAGSRSSSTRLGLVALSGLMVTGLVVTVSAASTDSVLPETVRPVLGGLAGPFGRTGLDLHVGGLMAVLALMFGCYTIVVRIADRLSARMVLMSIAALYAIVLLAPPLISTDVFSYQAYGRMFAMYGANPYLQGPHVILDDPLYPFIGAKWVTTPTAYGPVFTALSYVIAPLSIAASALAYKAIAAVASLATVAVVFNTARLRGTDPVKAAALVGLNPLIVVYGVGGGHNDMLMLALVVAGLALVFQHRERAGAGLMVLAAGVKLTAGLFLPFALAGAGGPLARSRRRDIVIGASAAATIVAAVGFATFGGGLLHLPATVLRSQREGDWHSIPGFIGEQLGLGVFSHVVALILAAVFVATFCWLLRRVWRGELDWIDGAGWATVVLLLTASSFLPWYVAWLLPLAALASDRRLWRSAIVMTGVVQAIQLLGYIPHGISMPAL
jgi:hypothetical protein